MHTFRYINLQHVGYVNLNICVQKTSLMGTHGHDPI
jgi:hypothetical protein